jgi:hypothetical protein
MSGIRFMIEMTLKARVVMGDCRVCPWFDGPGVYLRDERARFSMSFAVCYVPGSSPPALAGTRTGIRRLR